jgi:hypothetical protein
MTELPHTSGMKAGLITYGTIRVKCIMADPVMPPFVVIPRQKKTAPKKAVKRSAKKMCRVNKLNKEKIIREEDRHKINEEGCEEVGSQEKQKDGEKIQCSIGEEGQAKTKEIGILKVPTRGFLRSLARR